MIFLYDSMDRTEVWKMVDKIRKTAGLENTVLDTFRLLFLRYAEDNYNDGTGPDWEDADGIRNFFARLDVRFRLGNILANEKNTNAYLRIFSENGADIRGRLREMVACEDLREMNPESHAKGMAIVETFSEIFESREGRVNFQNEFGTRNSVSSIAAGILKVGPGDTFLDFAAGTGFSTFAITKGTRPLPRVINIDVDPEMSAVEAMLYIMYGYEGFKVVNGDAIRNIPYACRADRIFVDGPVGRFSDAGDDEYSNMTLATIKRVMDLYMKQDGRAVVTVPGKFLFSSARMAADIRRELVLDRRLEAVYSLPETHLLVIGETPREGIRFVNLLDGRMETVKSPDEVAEKDFSIIPEDYVFRSPQYHMTRDEIDRQLREKYRQLAELGVYGR